MRFDSREKEIAHEKSELELKKLKATPLQFNQDISVWKYQLPKKPTAAQLGVDYHYSITNVSNQRIKIALVVVHGLLLPPQTLGNAQMSEIPAISVGKNSPWRRLISKAYLASDEELPNGVVESKEGFTITPVAEQGTTGDLEPSGANWGTLSTIAHAQKADYVGFSVDAFVRFADGTERWITGDQYARLIPGDYTGSPNAGKADQKK